MPFDPERPRVLHTHQGGRGFPASPQGELLLLVAGSLFSGDLFYERAAEREARFALLAAEVTQQDPEFVALLATYARQVLGLRSGPSALVAHLFWWGPVEVARGTAQRVWLRGDEHLETLAYTRAQGWRIRKALKRAVAQRLNAMSPQALLKYRQGGRGFRQRDALILCHPKAPDREHALVYEWLVRGRKARPEARALVETLLVERPTWERILSRKGSTPEAWREALPHLSGLALVRNLNNLHRHGLLGDPGVQGWLARRLGDPGVARWGLFPYQWLQALLQGEELGYPPAVLSALEGALEASLPSLPLQGESLVLVDVSGSMYHPLSARSQATYALAAASLGALLYRATGGQLYGFDSHIIPLPYGPDAPLGRMVRHLLEAGGGGTHLGEALRKTLPGFPGRRVVILTDEQVADDAYTPLRRWLGEDPSRVAHVVNMAGYGPLAFPERGVSRVAGFSGRLLELLAVLEAQDPAAHLRARVSGASLAGEEEGEEGEEE